jgi:hypothetical protein
MTDEEFWRSSRVPQRLLDFVRAGESARKLRLVACAYSRDVWDSLTDKRSRNAVEIAEGFADASCSVGWLNHAQDEAALVASESLMRDPKSPETRALRLAVAATNEDAYTAAYLGTQDTHRHPQSSSQLWVLRDIFGNPFRPVAFDPAWRTHTTAGIAAKMYADRNFSAMPILADALEEAGCDNVDVLLHCREPGTHVRGCWVVDLVLGKQ